MVKNFSLKTMMMMIILLPVVVVMLIIGGMAFHGIYDAMNDEIDRYFKSEVSNISGKITGFLSEKEGIVSSTAMVLAQKNYTDQEILNILTSVKPSGDGVLNVFAGFENKKYLESNGWVPKEDYDPRTRGWYKKAIANNGATYSEVYKDAGTGQCVVSVVRSITDVNGKLVGVVGVDLALDVLHSYLKTVKVSDTGYVFIVDDKLNFIYHPQFNLTDNVATANEGKFKEMTGWIGKTDNVSIKTYNIDGKDKMYTLLPMKNIGWNLIMAVPND